MEVAVRSFHFFNGSCPFVGVIAVSLSTALFPVTAGVLLQGPASYFPPSFLSWLAAAQKALLTTRPNIHLSANNAHQFGVK
jgi:hypothetical protein